MGPASSSPGCPWPAASAVVVLATADSFGEVVRLDLDRGVRTTLTDHGSALPDVRLAHRTEREFAVSDGSTVHGWLLHDPDREGPRPLLLDVHGGPHNAWNGAADAVHVYHQELVARGWAVLLLNPRGSDGYGEEFFTGVAGEWGAADARDFLEPVDALVAEGLADPRRLAIAGYSYGGFTTCYLTAHDDRFAAAVTGGVVSDLTSMVGSSDDGTMFADLELGALPWTDPERYARLSPLSGVDRVRTPTLVLHGADDVRCPVGQAQAWHHALRVLGVPTRLVLYPGASHLFILDGPLSQRVDYNRRVLEWLEQYAGDASGPRPRGWTRSTGSSCSPRPASATGWSGAQLGILRTDPDGAGRTSSSTAAAGCLNRRTGSRVTADSLFQVGSVTKVYTATVALQLVDEGLVDLDAPLVGVLPGLRLADPDTTSGLTLRHLLTHTSGLDGDLFTDTGRGDDCLAGFTDGLAEAGQNHPLGATWSYCNAGFSLAGRVIEVLTGQTWDTAMRERLFDPLGLEHTVTLPEEALLHDTAVGHQAPAGQRLEPTPVWGLPRSTGPAGTVSAAVADVLAFARMHLHGGRAPDGGAVLSAATCADMADRHADLPDTHTLGDSWGLGWIRYDWDGHRLLGHDGSTLGQGAVLRLLPEAGLAVALLTNGGDVRSLAQDLLTRVFGTLAGVTPPAPLAPPAEPVGTDLGPYAGVYERASVRMDLTGGPDGARLTTTVTGPLAELLPETSTEHEVVGLDPDAGLFLARSAGDPQWSPLTLYSLPTGERYLHLGGRATRQVSPA